MIIGKIDYINLLPFYVFLKRVLNSNEKKALEFYKGVPSKINRDFKKGRVEAAVISSVLSKRHDCSDFGIVAFKEVLSVLVCEGEDMEDSDSNTSNVLAKLLGVKGRVYIGDKALLKQGPKCKDLAALWYEKHGLPFVFARFCYKKNGRRYKELSDRFLKSNIKIPHYILARYAKKRGVSKKEIRRYLRLIHYKIDRKGEKSLKKFLDLTKNL